MSALERSGRSRSLLIGGAAALASIAIVGMVVTGSDGDGPVELSDVSASVQPNVIEPSIDAAESPSISAPARPVDPGNVDAEPLCDEGVARNAGAGELGIVVSEIHYHPLGGDGFVELFNSGGAAVDLSGWRIAGLDRCFVAGTVLEAGAFLVVDEGAAAGRLDNGGEELAIVAPGGVVVEAIEFDDRGEWPALADGHGYSLQRLDTASSGSDPGNWVSGEPSPGARLPDSPALPVWSDVAHTVLPAAGQEIEVTASLAGVHDGRAQLFYRVGFGDEVAVEVELEPDGTASASIPGQEAGALIRYRLTTLTSAEAEGTWPRQGAGVGYTGTTVATPATDTELLVVEWFMQEPEFQVAFNDRAVGREETYPAVIAVNGQVFDAAQIRVKGQSSRFLPKPKWKIELAPGQRLEVDGLIDRWVDEFALHGSYNDKSAVREILAHEAMAAAGVPVSDVFPVRLLRNGEFFGLYNYVEQPDGRWRDRVGLDGAVYEVGDRFNTRLQPGDSELVGAEFDGRFQREAGDDQTDEQLRDFLRELNDVSVVGFDADERRDWFFDNVDVPGVVNALAVAALIQHEDLRTKNYRLAHMAGRWTLLPFDLDLTWGRLYGEAGVCEALCDDVGISERPDRFIASNTVLVRPFAEDPVLAEMTRTRIAALRDELLDPNVVREHVDRLVDVIGDDAVLERAEWGTYGQPQSIPDAADELVVDFVVPQFERLSSPGSPFDVDQVVLGGTSVAIELSEVGVRLRNDGIRPADLSGRAVSADSAEIVVPAGLVLPSGWVVELGNDSTVTWVGPAG